ncbi:metal dependent phosphohydrolase [Thermincola ferriacetica]|uniref:Metal dependent phosphohydrolase n=1 Tax=Thermincola ferriacetica TaxID=281456 RepID=A0A0L6W7F2_9FIRM|nr:HD-GYP domain-containing protein [Thermincola ferriacetica]KNZ71029.1 metal dependent phosphohydrolase [Thermincola ferriacetica]
MRRVLTGNLTPEMSIARTIFSANGFPLLAAGTQLNDVYIGKLASLGINAIYVKTGMDNMIHVYDPVSERTRAEAIKALKKVFLEFAKTGKLRTDLISGHVNNIVDEALRNRKKVINTLDVRSMEDYLYGHCVNVCILAVLTAINMEYNELQLRDIGLGAILHDLGHMLVEKEILQKQGPLTPEEMAKIRKHCEYGFEPLRELRNISLLSAHTAYQHHERFDGSGYPRGLRGHDIHEYARIVAICDVFDAMTMDRPFHRAYHPHEAMKLITESAGKLFDPEIVAIFKRIVACYPAGDFVEMSSGEVGIICDHIKEAESCKTLALILLDKHKRPLVHAQEIVIKNSAEEIHRVLKDNDPLIQLCYKLNATESIE